MASRVGDRTDRGDRYVLLGLAHPRSEWFRAVAHWATSGNIPAEFVKCISADEVRARLSSARPFSAALVDAALPALDRDLVHAARDAGCAVLAVADHRARSDWADLGVVAVLPPYFDPQALVAALEAHAGKVGRADAVPVEAMPPPPPPSAWRGRVAMVCGPGGTGASTAAIALAQGLADDPRHGRSVLLADLALHAEQAMLHDARDVVPGVQELVEAHRSGRPAPEEVRSLTYDVRERGYHLLLGLRQARAWNTLQPTAFTAAFDSLRSAFRMLVCDADSDLEGDDDSGSIDVEERNVMARTAASAADVVFATGVPGMKGLHSLVRVVTDLLAFGVAPGRIVPVVNRGPKSPRLKAEITSALSLLVAEHRGQPRRAALCSPVFLPERNVDALLRDGARLPTALTDPLAGAFTAVTDKGGAPAGYPHEPRRVEPGSLGSWTVQDGTEPAALG